MIPILYSSQRSYFNNNGIGALIDATLCECTEKLNERYELRLEIPITGSHAKEIRENYIIKARANYEDPLQLFRVYSVEKNYDNTISVSAAHISYDTAGIPVLPFTSDNLDDAVDNMNNNRKTLTESGFVLNADFKKDGELKVESPASFRSILCGGDNTIVGVYGGEYHYNNFVINLLEKRGHDNGISFRYGKNISNFEQESNSEELYTAVLGYWKKSGNNNDEIIYGNIIKCNGNFPFEKIYILDTSNEIKNDNNAVATEEQIDECVEKYIADKSVGLPKKTMKIDYADDNDIIKVCLGDRVGVIFPDYDIYTIARCNTVVFDTLKEKNKSIEVGVESKDVSDSIVDLLVSRRKA